VRRRPLHAAHRARRRVVPTVSRMVGAPRRLATPLRRLPRAVPSLRAVSAALWPRDGSVRSRDRRRVRALAAGAVLLASVVLLTSFPLGEVLSQRAALSSTARQLSTVEAENATLARQADALSHAATVEGLARHDFGFVRSGQSVYDILPRSGTSAPATTGGGHVPLDGPPVVPGSARSQALLGVVTPPGTGTGTVDGASVGAGGGPPAAPHGYWGRIVRTLEFWN